MLLQIVVVTLFLASTYLNLASTQPRLESKVEAKAKLSIYGILIMQCSKPVYAIVVSYLSEFEYITLKSGSRHSLDSSTTYKTFNLVHLDSNCGIVQQQNECNQGSAEPKLNIVEDLSDSGYLHSHIKLVRRISQFNYLSSIKIARVYIALQLQSSAIIWSPFWKFCTACKLFSI